MGELHTLDRTGDTKIIWDAERQDEVDAARATFDKLRGKRYMAYSVKKDGSKGKIITAFDPDAEKIILAPPMAGG